MEGYRQLWRQKLYLLWKRGVDIGVAAGLLLLLTPLLVAIGVSIWLEDRHFPLFRQLRVGEGGRLFWLYKFRTMAPDAPHRLERVLAQNPHLREQWERFRKLDPDPRVTKVGRLLRKSSLDELPQLWNILKGEMSLVGPRPYLPEELEGDREFYNCYIQMRPGLTGLWQVEGRHSLPFHQRKELDCRYFRERGVWTDLKILLKTPLILWKGA